MNTGSHRARERDEAPADRSVARNLIIAQFILTAVVLGGVGSLAYFAGRQSAGGGHQASPPGSAAGVGSGAEGVNVQALLTSTLELVEKGKSLFAVNCASCHGNEGRGDGPAAAALNPKPRNFTDGYWRYGGGIARVVQTLTVGSPGTAMAGYSALSLSDRFALAHYVRSLGPSLNEDTPEDLAWLGPGAGAQAGASGQAAAGGAAVEKGPTIPIEQAMAALTVADSKPGRPLPIEEMGAGARLWAERCASCHGWSGEGGVPVRMLGSNPYAYVTTRSLAASSPSWADQPAAFERLITHGLPGFVMPGNGDLSRRDVSELYAHTLLLRARQAAARSQS